MKGNYRLHIRRNCMIEYMLNFMNEAYNIHSTKKTVCYELWTVPYIITSSIVSLRKQREMSREKLYAIPTCWNKSHSSAELMGRTWSSESEERHNQQLSAIRTRRPGSEVLSALVSHSYGQWFESGWMRSCHPTVEKGAWIGLELGEWRRPGMMLTSWPTSMRQVKECKGIETRRSSCLQSLTGLPLSFYLYESVLGSDSNDTDDNNVNSGDNFQSYNKKNN